MSVVILAEQTYNSYWKNATLVMQQNFGVKEKKEDKLVLRQEGIEWVSLKTDKTVSSDRRDSKTSIGSTKCAKEDWEAGNPT